MKEISFQNDVLPLKNKLVRLAIRITRNREDAEDVVQETLMKVWTARDRWQELDSIEAYSKRADNSSALSGITSKRGGGTQCRRSQRSPGRTMFAPTVYLFQSHKPIFNIVPLEKAPAGCALCWDVSVS